MNVIQQSLKIELLIDVKKSCDRVVAARPNIATTTTKLSFDFDANTVGKQLKDLNLNEKKSNEQSLSCMYWFCEREKY